MSHEPVMGMASLNTFVLRPSTGGLRKTATFNWGLNWPYEGRWPVLDAGAGFSPFDKLRTNGSVRIIASPH